MPVDRPARRVSCTKPKYTFSDDDDDFDDPPPSKVPPSHSPPPTPSPASTSPARPSHARKRDLSHIPRPRNAFIIFRSEFCERQKMSEKGIESDHRHISRIAAHVWNNLDEREKAVYRERAEAEKVAHRATYPNYRYAPVGRPKLPPKRKVKRDGKDDTSRSRKLAELLLSGIEGDEFVQAVKGLDEGAVQVELTQRTSRPAAGRPKHAPRATAYKSSIKIEPDFETHLSPVAWKKADIRGELPSEDPDVFSPIASPSLSDALYTIDNDDEGDGDGDTDEEAFATSALIWSLPPSPREPESEDDTPPRSPSGTLSIGPRNEGEEEDSAEEGKHDKNIGDKLLLVPERSLSTGPVGLEPELDRADNTSQMASHHISMDNIYTGALDSLTLAQLLNNDSTIHMPCIPPPDVGFTSPFHEFSGAPGLGVPWLCTSSGPTSSSMMLPSAVGTRADASRMERSPSPVTITSTSTPKAGNDFLSHHSERLELTYPDEDSVVDEVELEEYLTGL